MIPKDWDLFFFYFSFSLSLLFFFLETSSLKVLSFSSLFFLEKSSLKVLSFSFSSFSLKIFLESPLFLLHYNLLNMRLFPVRNAENIDSLVLALG